jgi:hypothetical protein
MKLLWVERWLRFGNKFLHARLFFFRLGKGEWDNFLNFFCEFCFMFSNTTGIVGHGIVQRR